MEEYEYADPYEDKDNWSHTPAPVCDGPDHKICITPAWGDGIPGILYGVGVFCVFEMTNTMLSGVRSAVMPPVAAHVFGGTCVATTTPAAPFADMVTPGITTL